MSLTSRGPLMPRCRARGSRTGSPHSRPAWWPPWPRTSSVTRICLTVRVMGSPSSARLVSCRPVGRLMPQEHLDAVSEEMCGCARSQLPRYWASLRSCLLLREVWVFHSEKTDVRPASRIFSSQIALDESSGRQGVLSTAGVSTLWGGVVGCPPSSEPQGG